MATDLDQSTSGPAHNANAGIGVVQWVLAALLLGAAAVHFALAPSHFGESAVEGIGFLVAAWSQLVLAVLVLFRPTRAVATAIVAVSAACIAAWVVSRTAGLPFGEHADHAESVTIVDGLTVVMEGLTIAFAASLHSSRVRRYRADSVAFVSVVAVLGLTSALLAAPEARNHSASAHGEVSGHDHGTTSAQAAASGHDHGTTSAQAAASGHDHGAATASADKKALTDLNGHEIHGVKADDVAAEQQPDELLDPQTRTVLAQQLVAARDVALRYPTVADAERGGFHLVGGGYGPGAGSHYIGFGGGFGSFDAGRPPTLIYNGTSQTASIVGLMYLGSGAGGVAPEGFAGPNDHWHRHSGVCLKGAEVIFPPDSDVTEAQCTAKGGRYMAVTTWMVHAWVVPGWESSAGVFSHENPNLPCADGTFETDAIGRCVGPGDVVQTATTPAQNAATVP